VDVIALTDDSTQREVLLDAGADSVLSPHGALGHRLAEKAASSVRTELTDTVELGSDIEVTEIPIHQDSRLTGTSIRNSRIREQTGANIIGLWIDGELQLPPDPDTVIHPNTCCSCLANTRHWRRSVRSILTRVSDADTTRKALSADADYVLSVPRVSARMVATELRGEDVLQPASQIRFIRVSADPLAGTTLADSEVYEDTGCRVIAIEDDDGLSATVDPNREFTGDEQLTLLAPTRQPERFC